MKEPAAPRAQKYFVSVAVQVLIFAVCGVGAFFLRFRSALPRECVPYLITALLVWTMGKTLIFASVGLFKATSRSVSAHDVFKLGSATFGSCLVTSLLIEALSPAGFPRLIYFLDFGLSLFACATVMLFRGLSGRRTLIYGAGTSGLKLLREYRGNSNLGFSVIGLIDDDPSKRGTLIHGVPVLGTGIDLPKIVNREGVEQIFVAIPNASGAQMRRILSCCVSANVNFGAFCPRKSQ